MPPRRVAPPAVLIGLLAVAVLAFGFVLYELRRTAPPGQPAPAEAAAIGGPFALVDQDGTARTDADFRGKLLLIYFGYTYCPDICALALASMGAAIDRLGDKGEEVAPVFITVDPGRDTPARLKEYVAPFNPRLVALTGDSEQVEAALKAYRVYAARHDEGEGRPYLMDHSSIVYLMDRQNRYLGHFNHATAPEAMAAAIAAHL